MTTFQLSATTVRDLKVKSRQWYRFVSKETTIFVTQRVTSLVFTRQMATLVDVGSDDEYADDDSDDAVTVQHFKSAVTNGTVKTLTLWVKKKNLTKYIAVFKSAKVWQQQQHRHEIGCDSRSDDKAEVRMKVDECNDWSEALLWRPCWRIVCLMLGSFRISSTLREDHCLKSSLGDFR